MAQIEVKILRVDGNELDLVNAARESYGIRKEDFHDVKDVRLIHRMIDEGHTSPFEQVGILWHIKMPLFIAEQFKRHRMFSINELSRRYTDKNVEMFEFESLRMDSKEDKQGSEVFVWDPGDVTTMLRLIDESNSYRYEQLRLLHLCKEQARAVLPTRTMTSMTVHTDLHNLMHYLELRLDSHAQEEHQDLANQMYNHAVEHFTSTLCHAARVWVIRRIVRDCLAKVRRSELTMEALTGQLMEILR